MPFLFDPYFLVTVPGILLALWAQWRLSSAYGRFSRVGTDRGITGAQAARHILDRNGLPDVEVVPVPGHLTDHYDPSKRAVFLSEGNYGSTSVAAVGVAAHEVGHALQHQAAYAPLHLRMAMVGATNFATRAAWIAIMGGMVLSALHAAGALGRLLLLAGIGLFMVVVFFQLVTLPVEYDASRRAKIELNRLGLVTPREGDDVSAVLSAAALTYVAALVSAMLELLRLVLYARSAMDDDRR